MTLLLDFAPVPLLSDQSAGWCGQLIQRASALAFNAQMPLSDVLAMPLSFEFLYYTSPAWSDRQKQIEHGDVISNNFFERLSNLQLSLNALMRAR